MSITIERGDRVGSGQDLATHEPSAEEANLTQEEKIMALAALDKPKANFATAFDRFVSFHGRRAAA